MEENNSVPYRKIIIVCSALLVLAALGAASYATIHLNMFTVEEIYVDGNRRITEREIIKRSGLRRGETNIFFFEDQVEQEILKNPWVKTVSVRKEFPKKVYIEIEEEKVYCVVLTEQGKPLYISRTGRILGNGNFDMGLDFPVLIGEGIKDPVLLKEALDILELSRSSSVLKWDDISELHIDPIYGIDVFTTDHRRIEFDRNNIVEKWHKVEKIIRHSSRLGLKESYINIGTDGIGVVNYKLPAAASGAEDG